MSRITKIEIQKRNKERVNIHIDGEYAFSANVELIYKEKLNNNMEVDQVRLEGIIRESNYLKCKETSLRIITRSYKTESELINRLYEKGYNNDEIERTIEFLKEYNFINDKEFTKMYVKDRLRSQGINKIKYSLVKKGICEEQINDVIDSIDSDKESEVALTIGMKKYKQLLKKEDDEYKIKSKLGNYLISKGYDYSLVKEITNKLLEMDKGGQLWS